MKQQTEILKKIKAAVKECFKNDYSGHDWWHIFRVYKMAIKLAKQENKPVDLFIIKVAALLHEFEDYKFKSKQISSKKLLDGLKFNKISQDKILHITRNISFKGAKLKNTMQSLEGFIIQDADRLDAIGAIGIARCFTFNGFHHGVIYDPKIKPVLHDNFKMYQKIDPAINHFYEKLLLIKDRLNTPQAKKIALNRHKFMKLYLQQFYAEWKV